MIATVVYIIYCSSFIHCGSHCVYREDYNRSAKHFPNGEEIITYNAFGSAIFILYMYWGHVHVHVLLFYPRPAEVPCLDHCSVFIVDQPLLPEPLHTPGTNIVIYPCTVCNTCCPLGNNCIIVACYGVLLDCHHAYCHCLITLPSNVVNIRQGHLSVCLCLWCTVQ